MDQGYRLRLSHVWPERRAAFGHSLLTYHLQRTLHPSGTITSFMSDYQANKQAAKDTRLERHSGTGRTGEPAKGGKGGKYVWGGQGTEVDPKQILVDIENENAAQHQQEEEEEYVE